MPGECRATGGKGLGAAGPPEHEQLACPRCESSNTKFCYYNNYNFSQPRHFCKSCRRYWTQGGTLRDIPIGGGTRKTNTAKRPRTLPGSFTSLLNAGTSAAPTTTTTTTTTTAAFLSFGSPIWGFPPLGYMPTHGATLGGLMRTWHMDTAADHPAGGFSSTELPISTTGHALN